MDQATKWASYALLGIYIWVMVLTPLSKLFTHDPKDKTLKNSRSRWFLQLLVGLVPLLIVGYSYFNPPPPPPPPPPPEMDLGEFASKIEVFSRALENPKVVYLPYPSTATPVLPVAPPVTNGANTGTPPVTNGANTGTPPVTNGAKVPRAPE